MVIVDDHLALLAVAGRLPALHGTPPVVTTWSFQFRLARALADSNRAGYLSRRVPDPSAALRRVLEPPAHRLAILDPRTTTATATDFAVRHRSNVLLAELAGAALHYGAAVRVTPANRGRNWAEIMEAEGVDFGVIEP